MKRRTQCCCGQVSVVVEGDPILALICHCDYCQQRTGSVFNVSCWFPNDRVLELNGETKIFNSGPNSEAIGLNYEFCPNCGSTVHWSFRDAKYVPNPILENARGFAVGCFVDPDFPLPQFEGFTLHKHHWVDSIEGLGLPSFEGLPATNDEFDGEMQRRRGGP